MSSNRVCLVTALACSLTFLVASQTRAQQQPGHVVQWTGTYVEANTGAPVAGSTITLIKLQDGSYDGNWDGFPMEEQSHTGAIWTFVGGVPQGSPGNATRYEYLVRRLENGDIYAEFAGFSADGTEVTAGSGTFQRIHG